MKIPGLPEPTDLTFALKAEGDFAELFRSYTEQEFCIEFVDGDEPCGYTEVLLEDGDGIQLDCTVRITSDVTAERDGNIVRHKFTGVIERQ